MESLEVSAKTVDEAVELALERMDARLSEVEIVVLSEGRAGILGLGAEDARIRVVKLDSMQTGRSRISGANFPPRPPTIYAEHPGAPQDEDDWEGEEELGPSTLEQPRTPASQQGRGRTGGGGQRGDRGARRPGGAAGPGGPPRQGSGPQREGSGPPRPASGPPRQGSGPPRQGGGQGERNDRGGGAPRFERDRNQGGGGGQRGGDRRQREPAIRPQQRTDRELPAPPPPSSPLAELAQGIIQEMVNRLGLVAVVAETKPPADDSTNPTPILAFDIQGDDLGSLIGRRGQTLSSLQYLVNLMMRQQSKESLMVVVDVEGYRARRYGSLAGLAQRIAERVRSSGQPVTLEPMTAAERRVIHITLKEFPDLATQSVGEGENRKVNIIPKKQ